MASSEAIDPEKPEIEQRDQPQVPEEIITQTGIPEQQAPNSANIADPHNTAQSHQTDKPWSPKDTFKWMISILRCHNALASSHVRLQAEVNQLRQEIVEAAKHPIPPIFGVKKGPRPSHKYQKTQLLLRKSLRHFHRHQTGAPRPHQNRRTSKLTWRNNK